MPIASRLHQFLDEQRANYELIAHTPTKSSIQSAEICHIPRERMAKAVLLDADEEYLLAVLPADRRIELEELRSELGLKPRLADEEELAIIFDDCVIDAVPPLGSGYDVPTIIDDSLEAQPDAYFEAGDDVSLIHMDHAEFSRWQPYGEQKRQIACQRIEEDRGQQGD